MQIPFAPLPGAGVKIATGSYVGTGTYGASNPCSLTFDFVPKIWGVYMMDGGADRFIPIINIWTWGLSSTSKMVLSYYRDMKDPIGLYFGFSGKTATWYAAGSDAICQLNSSGYTYYYFAIG